MHLEVNVDDYIIGNKDNSQTFEDEKKKKQTNNEDFEI